MLKLLEELLNDFSSPDKKDKVDRGISLLHNDK